MSDQISKWKAEHSDCVRLPGILKSQIGLFREASEANYELMFDIVFYLKQYPDRFHHPREDIVFRMLAKRDPSAQIRVREPPRRRTHTEPICIAGSGTRQRRSAPRLFE